MNKNSALYASGVLLLGLVTLYFGDFAMQWQHVPKNLPARLHMPLVYLTAALLVAGGAGMLTRKWERAGALLLAVFFGFWVIALHLPAALAGAGHIGAWNGPAEITLLTMGPVALLSASAGAMRVTVALIARLLAGVCALVFGLAHFNYIDFTASMVPSWLPPSTVFWAWATGVGHFAAGVALVSGIQARLAATLLAGMMASFVLFVHIPRVIASPGQHVEWIMLAVSSSLAGATWLIRKYAT
jgi:uncharacterized membrane protein YphA (DoxX/SURF4 family)